MASPDQDKQRAKYMKERPWEFPDSARRPWPTPSHNLRSLAQKMGKVLISEKQWQWGMLGGVLAARLGYGDYGIPKELLK